jgi:hypothetical protein
MARTFSRSYARVRSDGSRFRPTFGIRAGSRRCTQPRLIIRAAIQSLSTMMSRPIGSQAASWGWILPKNSLLSLMSSVYVTWMPVRAWNASRVGRLDSLSSATSRYWGQLEKARVFSVAERSSLTQLAAVCRAPLVPQAPSRAPVANSAAEPVRPRSRVRRGRGVRGWGRVRMRRLLAGRADGVETRVGPLAGGVASGSVEC